MRHWTATERQTQSQLIHRSKPWKKSTGAKTPEGKAKSKMNVYKHGGRSAKAKYLKSLIRECRRLYRKPSPI